MAEGAELLVTGSLAPLGVPLMFRWCSHTFCDHSDNEDEESANDFCENHDM